MPILVNPYRFGAPPSSGAASFISSSSGANTSTVTMPTGATTGDHLFVTAVVPVASTATISGGLAQWDGQAISKTGSMMTYLFYKKLDGSEGSSLTLTVSSGNSAYAAVLYRGGGNPGLVGANSENAASTSITSHLRAPSAGVALHFYYGGVNGGPTLTGPTGPTMRANQPDGSFFVVGVAEEHLSAGDDVTQAATLSTAGAVYADSVIIPDSGSVPAPRSWTINGGNSTNATITIPSTTQVGDLIIVGYQVTSALISAGPSGYTAFDGPGNKTGGSRGDAYYWGYKVAASGDIGAAATCTSASQVWNAACLVLTNPAATPVATVGTATTGTTSTPTIQSTTATAGTLAVHFFAASVNSGGSVPEMQTGTIKGLWWLANRSSGFGSASIAVSSCPSGTATLAPTTTIPGSGTRAWFSNTVLLNLS